MTAVTLEQIRTKQDQLAADHKKVVEMLTAFEAASKSVSIVLAAATIEIKPGENFAGLMLDENGTPSHYLIDLGEATEAEGSYDKHMARAIEGGFDLPTPEEQALLYANLKTKFKQRWYFSKKPFGSYNAYFQGFADGVQGWYGRLNEFLGRGVRRVSI